MPRPLMQNPSSQSNKQGLPGSVAAERLRSMGANELPVARPRSNARLLADVVAEPMFLLLVGCGAIYLLLGDPDEALMLLGFVAIVVAMTFFQQRRTEHSLHALRDLSAPRVLVLRDGQQVRIAGRELVVGDVVLLAEGDRVPADIDLLNSSNLMVDESLLTGESVPVSKQLGASAALSRIYSGTLVTQGTARGVVSATGSASALGQIGASLAALGGELTPIQQETRHVVKRVASAGGLLAAALALAHWYLNGAWLQGVLAGLTLAMAILPEELPVILTLFLGLGAWRLGRAQILARSIPAIELLGATTVLCVDKTGTLTANRMQVLGLCDEQTSFDAGTQAATLNDTPQDTPQNTLPEALHGLLEYAVLASHRQAFDPMEQAITAAGERWLANTEHLHRDWQLIDDYPLTRQLLAMSRVWQSPDGSAYLVAAKGAPEAIIDLCHLDPARSARIGAQVGEMAQQGLRVIAVASARFTEPVLPDHQHAFEFQFLGLVALQDPIRAEVPAAVAACHTAGMQVVMITGDHPATASAIARQAGIHGEVLTGSELAALDDAALAARLSAYRVFCRIAPEQKLRLVQAFRARGEIVAMTGDGVNDAPALKAAHIGVAMGARGTDVAREAAALVLLKDDFSSLLLAVQHGRRLFANLRKAIVFIVAVHVPIVGLSILPLLLGWPMLLMPVHILFLQLVIDPACSLVFEAEAIEAGAMQSPPRPTNQHLFERSLLLRGLLQGGLLLAVLLGWHTLLRASGASEDTARSATFFTLVLANLGLIFSNLSWRLPLWRRSQRANRPFYAISGAALLLLAVVLGLDTIRSLFAFALPSAAQTLASVLLALLCTGCFEWLKRRPD